MIKQLKVGTNALMVTSVYPFRYDYGKGKQVLRVEIQETDHGFDYIKSLLANCETPMDYYEGETVDTLLLKNSYENYSLDFNAQYNNGVYSVEVTRLNEQEQDIKALDQAIADMAELIGGIL